MQYKEVAGGICAPKGFAAAGVHCGIRANHAEKYDLALIKADVRCAAAGVYTTNKVCGAPIKVDRAHLTDGYAQAIVVNSGPSNNCHITLSITPFRFIRIIYFYKLVNY